MSFGPGSGGPGSGFPLDGPEPIPQELPFIGSPIALPAQGNLYEVMAHVIAAGLEIVWQGEIELRRYAHVRSEPWRLPEASPYTPYPMVAKAGGESLTMVKGIAFVERKFIISKPHTALTSINALTDTIVCDGVEAPIWKARRVPEAGAEIMFWNVKTRLGVEAPGAA